MHPPTHALPSWTRTIETFDTGTVGVRPGSAPVRLDRSGLTGLAELGYLRHVKIDPGTAGAARKSPAVTTLATRDRVHPPLRLDSVVMLCLARFSADFNLRGL